MRVYESVVVMDVACDDVRLHRLQLVLLELLAVFTILYLPFCIYRKCRNGAMMARCMRSPHFHSDGNSQQKEIEKTAESPTEPKKEEQADIKPESDQDEHAAG